MNMFAFARVNPQTVDDTQDSETQINIIIVIYFGDIWMKMYVSVMSFVIWILIIVIQV